MTSNRRLWTSLSLLLIASFSVLLWMGREIYHAAPPVPERVVAANGALLFDRDDIETGRIVFSYVMGRENPAGRIRNSASLATTEIVPDGAGTRLIYTEQGAFLESRDDIALREQGCTELFKALARELKAHP